MIRSIVLLATLLTCTASSVSIHAAQIKSKDGTLIEGEIRGTLVLRDLTHTDVGGGAWGLLYYVIPGSQITLINENGVHWSGGKDIVCYMYVMSLDPGNDLGGLSPDFRKRFNFLLKYKGGNSSDTTGPPGVDPIPMAVYGEVRFENEDARILPEIEVATAKGVRKVPVSSLIAVLSKSERKKGNSPAPNAESISKSKAVNSSAATPESTTKPKQAHLPTVTPQSIAWGKQILSSVKKAMGGSAIDRITDETEIANISVRSSGGSFVDLKQETIFKLPNKQLHVFGSPTKQVRMGFDGNTAWQVTPAGSKVVSSSSFREGLPGILGLVRDYNSERYTVQGLERSELEGRAVDAVAVTSKSDQGTVILFVDMGTHLPLKMVSSGATDGGVTEVLFSDYREVDGIKVAYKTTTMLNGTKQLEISLSDMKFNTGVSDSLFVKP